MERTRPNATPSTRHAAVLDAENTFTFLPGPMLGVTCPACFRDQLLKEVVSTGRCRSCGTSLELTLTAEVVGEGTAGSVEETDHS